MKADQAPQNPMQALIKAIFDVRPPVLRDISINTDPGSLETVNLKVAMTPELIQAWGEHCKGIGNTKVSFPQPPTERKRV